MTYQRVAITGSSGFLAQAILKRIKTKGCKVLSIKQDDYYQPGFKEKLRKFNPQLILHLGAYGNHSTQTDDMETFEANVVKTFLLLEATKDINYQAFLNFGTSSEYGKKTFAMKETDLLEPTTMYAGTKAAGTMIARAFAMKYDLPIVTVRPFSVYGPGEADFRFIPTIIRSLIKGEPLTLDPGASHDWVYIDDFVDGVEVVIKNIEALAGTAVNIGTGGQISNEKIVSSLGFISGKPLTVTLSNMRPNDSPNWRADNTTLRMCGWKPKTLLLVGLKRTYQYYKQIYEIN